MDCPPGLKSSLCAPWCVAVAKSCWKATFSRLSRPTRLSALPKDAVGKARMHLNLNSDNEAERLLKQARRQKSDPLELALVGTELHLRRFEHEQALAGLQKVRPARRDARGHAALHARDG